MEVFERAMAEELHLLPIFLCPPASDNRLRCYPSRASSDSYSGFSLWSPCLCGETLLLAAAARPEIRYN